MLEWLYVTPFAHAGLELRRDGLPLALWNRDVAAALPDGNIYGSWPAYIDIRPGGRALAFVSRCRLRQALCTSLKCLTSTLLGDLEYASERHCAQVGVHTGCSC